MSSTPPVIKRNTIYVALSQMFAGAGGYLVFALGPLMVVALTGSAAAAGIAIALQGVSRFVGSYPLGYVTDRYGRRPGLLFGLAVGLVGTVLVGLAMNAGSFIGFVVALLIFGIGMNGVQQLRLAAAEMYPPHRRAVIIGAVLSVSMVGVILSPTLVALAQALAPVFGLHELAVPWLLVPLFILPGAAFIWRIRPDPRDIAADLTRYYPDYVPAPADVALAEGGMRLGAFLADPQRRLSAIAMFAAHGSMQIAMVTAPLALTHHGSALPAVAFSMALHTAGMFGPSVPMGKLADRIGRRSTLIVGTIIEGTGGALAAFTTDFVTPGIVLVGVGWCAANVSSTALVLDSTHAAYRGRAIGILDSFAAAAGIATPLLVGPLVERWGIGSTGVLAIALLVPVFLLLAAAPMMRRSRAEALPTA